MKRGIIISPIKSNRINDTSVSFENNISIEDLYYYILYWDKIVMPTNNLFHTNIPFQDLLKNEMILERPVVKFTTWSTNSNNGYFNIYEKSQSIVANDLVKNNLEFDWTIHQIGDEVVIDNDLKTEFNAIKVALSNCLPVPNKSVNIEDLLEFKSVRNSEFIELHDTLDSFYTDILKSVDRDFESRKSVEKLNKAIANLNKVSKEKFSHSSKYNLVTEININPSKILLNVSGVALASMYFEPKLITIGSVLAGLASFINIKFNRTTSIEGAKDRLKLSYLSSAKNNNIII
ncbi:DUF6236 family protein [uncultured Chryseobacterium sp.]|uniref:DUF6236 family protein n=1 Tax=uncultured Chryseobacterium sp. TaxID=259322 RepID=UPI0037478F77